MARISPKGTGGEVEVDPAGSAGVGGGGETGPAKLGGEVKPDSAGSTGVGEGAETGSAGTELAAAAGAPSSAHSGGGCP